MKASASHFHDRAAASPDSMDQPVSKSACLEDEDEEALLEARSVTRSDTSGPQRIELA